MPVALSSIRDQRYNYPIGGFALRRLIATIDGMDAKDRKIERLVAKQAVMIEKLTQRIDQLERELAAARKDSSNSSKLFVEAVRRSYLPAISSRSRKAKVAEDGNASENRADKKVISSMSDRHSCPTKSTTLGTIHSVHAPSAAENLTPATRHRRLSSKSNSSRSRSASTSIAALLIGVRRAGKSTTLHFRPRWRRASCSALG